MPSGRARVALIKDDGTWDEKFVSSSGANLTDLATNAEMEVRMEFDRDTLRLPDPYIKVTFLSVEWDEEE